MWWLLLIIPALFVVGYFRDRRRIGEAKARRSLILHFACLGVLYCLTFIALVFMEDKLLFQPISFEELHLATQDLNYEEVTIHCATGNQLRGWWCTQEGAEWTILFCHGTGGNLSLHTMIVPMLQKSSKVNVLAFGYPGYSGSTGSPTEAGCYDSADAAYDWLLTVKKIKPERLMIFGQSLGGGVACNLAVKKPHAGLILLSTFTTLPERAQEFLPIFPVKWFMKNQFDNRSKLSRYTGPLLIAHGDNDDVVPFHHCEELFACSVSPRKEFCHIPGGTHVIFNQDFFRRVAGMMARLP